MSFQEEEPLDLSIVASTPIQNRISPNVVAQALSQPPFLPIPGALNIRDIAVNPYIRKGFVFRSGAVGHIQQSAKSSLSDKYGIKTIFDLRTQLERDQGPNAVIEGIETIWTQSASDEGDGNRVLHKIDPKDFVEENGWTGYLNMYTNILNGHKDAFKAVLMHLRDHKESGILFHCTGNFMLILAPYDTKRLIQYDSQAGRDRTGVLAALILGLAGASADDIAKDYALSRIGIEPAHEQLLAIFQAQTGFVVDQPGFAEMCSTRAKTMLSFLEMLDDRWGGAEGYVRKELGLEKRDIELIIENLRG